MAKKKKDDKQKQEEASRGGSSIGLKILFGLSAVPLILVLLPSWLVLAVCLIPTLITYLIDRERDKYFTLSVGSLNLCGAIPALVDLWLEGQTFDSAFVVILDPLSWLVAYGAAGVGLLIHLGMPPIIATYYAMASEARIRNLGQRQKLLIDAWGEEIGSGLNMEQGEANMAVGQAAG